MPGPAKTEYIVSVKDMSGVNMQAGVVSAKSPRNALDLYCRQLMCKVACAMKYSSFAEAQRAVVSAWGNYMIFEVAHRVGSRKNYYVTSTQYL